MTVWSRPGSLDMEIVASQRAGQPSFGLHVRDSVGISEHWYPTEDLRDRLYAETTLAWGAAGYLPAEPEPTLVQYAYRGVDREGCDEWGITTEHPERFTAACYVQGWRELKVWQLPDRESTVAEIGPHPETGRRDWWSVQEPEEVAPEQ
jgi:hypothetical protein